MLLWHVFVVCGVLMLGVFPVSGEPPKVSADQFEDLLGGVLMRGVWCVDAVCVVCARRAPQGVGRPV